MTHDDIVTLIINKELEKYNITIDHVRNIERWYENYTFDTQEEFDEWRTFSIDVLRKHGKMTKKGAEHAFAMLDLNWGLKRNYKM